MFFKSSFYMKFAQGNKNVVSLDLDRRNYHVFHEYLIRISIYK